MPVAIATVKPTKIETETKPATLPLRIPTYRPFGPLLKELRLSRSLTLERVAKAVRGRQGYMSGIENGRVRPPSPKYIARFARFFNIDEKDLVLLAYAEKAPMLIRDHVIRALWP